MGDDDDGLTAIQALTEEFHELAEDTGVDAAAANQRRRVARRTLEEGEDDDLGIGELGLDEEYAIEAVARDPLDFVEALFDEHTALVQRRAVTRRAQLNMIVCTRCVDDTVQEAAREAVHYARLPDDTFVGDARLRTVRALLHEIDNRGFERCAIAATPSWFVLTAPVALCRAGPTTRRG